MAQKPLRTVQDAFGNTLVIDSERDGFRISQRGARGTLHALESSYYTEWRMVERRLVQELAERLLARVAPGLGIAQATGPYNPYVLAQGE